MKTMLKIVSVAFLATILCVACSKNDDPADNDFFIGTYEGKISYSGKDKDVANTQGRVTVSKIASGKKYNFAFSNGIPNINGVEFERKGDNVVVNVGGKEGVNYIKINANKLEMLYGKDGSRWTADCTRR